jgi:Cys-tRNA(Pro)/Cys-tRNA(Cys) deacylase
VFDGAVHGGTVPLHLRRCDDDREVRNNAPMSDAPSPDTPAICDPRLDEIEHAVVRHGRVRSLEEAAALRGVDPSAVIKTMVVRRADDDHVFVLVPGDRVIDWPKLRAFLGEPDADQAFAITGYVRGTITPFGSAARLPVIADVRVTGRGAVSMGGGAHGVSITVDGDDVVRVLGAAVADVTGPQP